MDMKLKRFANLQYSAAALALAAAFSSTVLAQDVHMRMPSMQQDDVALADQSGADTLVQIVRQATARFQDVAVAEAAGYALQFGCVSGDDSGAMGLHYLNADILNSGVLDPRRPQIVIYEPHPDGSKRLIGADFLVFADAWNASHTAPPQLMGQAFHLFTSPNRFNLPAFYTLHVWAWKTSSKGAFVNWHPDVSCQSFTGQ
jgi:hypothetical protein